MDAIWALVTIVAILCIVLIGGYMIAVLVNMINGAFSGSNKSSKKQNEIMDYSEFKALDNSYTYENTKSYNNEIDIAKAKEEERKAEASAKENFKFEDVAEVSDLDEIENRLKAQQEQESNKEETIKEETTKEETVVPVENNSSEEDDLDSLLEGISNDVIEDTKDQINTTDEESVKVTGALDNYSIDEVLENISNNEESSEAEQFEQASEEQNEQTDIEAEQAEVEQETENVEPIVEESETESIEDVEETYDEQNQEEVIEESTSEETLEEVQPVEDNKESERQSEIEDLKKQVEELNRMLDQARSNVVSKEIVIDMTEEECLAKISIVEERLKNLRKDYKTNLKEYKPLRKVRENLEKYQNKLRRREAVAAKKKVALYGVNNYVDIDKDKAEKLANELELLDGLRLSVQHCEEVIESSKDRYPILENTNNILEEQIANTEADLEELNFKLQKIRENQGK